MCCEVNQLLTAIWSPIASVEQHRSPRARNGGNHVARFAFVVYAHDCWQLCAVLQDVHTEKVVDDRDLPRVEFGVYGCQTRLVKAPFLDSIIFTEPGAAPEVDDESLAEESTEEFAAEDFPAWYQDKVSSEDSDNPDAAGAETVASEDEGTGNYPFDLAVVQTADRLKFAPVTVIAGDNGSGKSTLVEAIAVAAGFNAEGGSRNLMFSTHDTHSALADHLLLRWNHQPRWGWFLRAETFYGMATHISRDDHPDEGLAAIFPDLHNQSHGETFLALARSRFTGKGLYIFDEPEAALSIQGQMQLAAIMAESVKKGSQFIVSTHSPFLMGFPDAAVYEADAEEGIASCSFDALASTVLWRRFLAEPGSMYKDLR